MRYRFIMAAAVFALAAAPAHGGEVLSLVASQDDPPYVGSELANGGLATAIVRAAFNAAGQAVDVNYLPGNRSYRAVVKGRFAGSFPYTYSDQRARDVFYSQPLHHVLTRAWVRSGGEVSIGSRGDLRRLTGCLPEGHQPTSATRGLYDSGATRRMRPGSLAACFRLLKRGRVDFVEASWLVGRARAGEVFDRPQDVRAASHVLEREALYFVVSRKIERAREVLHAFNTGLDRIKRSRVHSRLVQSFNSY